MHKISLQLTLVCIFVALGAASCVPPPTSTQPSLSTSYPSMNPKPEGTIPTPFITPTETLQATPTLLPSETPIPTLIFEPSPTVEPISALSADQLALAQKDIALADTFSFGGHEWTVAENQNGEKVWTREDGKVDLEWVDDLYGGRHPTYMFVTRSEKQEGKRNLEILTDPRYPVFDIITGTPDQIDVFVGQTVANVMESTDAQKALRQPGSTLKIIIGGIENWPIGNDGGKPQHIYYFGLNGEPLSQMVWGFVYTDKYTSGEIGPFVEPDNLTVECGVYFDSQRMTDTISAISSNPYIIWGDLEQAIENGINMNPKKPSLEMNVGFDYNLLKPIITPETQRKP